MNPVLVILFCNGNNHSVLLFRGWLRFKCTSQHTNPSCTLGAQG